MQFQHRLRCGFRMRFRRRFRCWLRHRVRVLAPARARVLAQDAVQVLAPARGSGCGSGARLCTGSGAGSGEVGVRVQVPVLAQVRVRVQVPVLARSGAGCRLWHRFGRFRCRFWRMVLAQVRVPALVPVQVLAPARAREVARVAPSVRQGPESRNRCRSGRLLVDRSCPVGIDGRRTGGRAIGGRCRPGGGTVGAGLDRSLVAVRISDLAIVDRVTSLGGSGQWERRPCTGPRLARRA